MDLPLNPRFVHDAFTTGVVATVRGDVRCVVHQIADLVLPTGRVVACDPLVFPESEAFTVTVAPGTYPVSLAVAQVGEVDQRVAFARVQFVPGEVVRWEMALLPDQDPATLRPNEIFGYGVDAGTGCFMDEETSRLLASRMSEDEELDQAIVDAMDRTNVPTWSWADIHPSAGDPANCVAFGSGWGDGVYASYFGYSQSGAAVCLVTDFDVLWREEAAVAPQPKPWWKFW